MTTEDFFFRNSNKETDPLFTVQKIQVFGAGDAAVNGIYTLTTTFNNVGRYTMAGHWKNQPCVFSIHLCDDEDCWYISTLPPGKEPGDHYVETELYSSVAKLSDNELDPPVSGWMVSDGEDPAPALKLGRVFVPSAAALKPVAVNARNMLDSEKFCDVKFLCSDGKAIPAHKCWLVGCSSYFEKALAGPWKESSSGELKTAHKAHVIKAMLSLLYTGRVDAKIIDKEPLEFMDVACEYNLPMLKTISERACIKSLDESTLKEFWQAARRFESDALKNVCVEYAKVNSLKVLANRDFVLLSTEDSGSWEEFSAAISSKRQKTRY